MIILCADAIIGVPLCGCLAGACWQLVFGQIVGGSDAACHAALSVFSFVFYRVLAGALREHADSVRSVAWREDSRLLVTCDERGEIKVRPVDTRVPPCAARDLKTALSCRRSHLIHDIRRAGQHRLFALKKR